MEKRGEGGRKCPPDVIFPWFFTNIYQPQTSETHSTTLRAAAERESGAYRGVVFGGAIAPTLSAPGVKTTFSAHKWPNIFLAFQINQKIHRKVMSF